MHISMKPLLPPRTTPAEFKPATPSRPRPEVRALGDHPGGGGTRSGRHLPQRGRDNAEAGEPGGSDPQVGFAAWLAKHDLDNLG